jgi:hypothetical protein
MIRTLYDKTNRANLDMGFTFGMMMMDIMSKISL